MRNAWEPIAIPRWAITAKYLAFVVVGVHAFVSGVPSLDLTTPDGYAPIWAGVIAFFAAVGAVGSLKPKWQWGLAECIGAFFLVCFLGVLIWSFWVRGSWGTGEILLIATMLPAVRAGFIATRLALIWRGWPMPL